MIDASTLSDDELLAAFCDTTLPNNAFHHQQHVHVAWLFLQRHGMPDVLREFPAALGRYADAKGATTLYHATITWAFLLLIHDRQQRAPAADWPSFAAANPDLLAWKPSLLESYYTAETLGSDLAKRTFLMPDRLARDRSSERADGRDSG